MAKVHAGKQSGDRFIFSREGTEISRSGRDHGKFESHEGDRLCSGRGAPGPLSRLPELVPHLDSFRATVLWVRDPITRALSCMLMAKGAENVSKALEWVGHTGTPRSASEEAAIKPEYRTNFEGLFEVPHAYTSLSWSVRSCQP